MVVSNVTLAFILSGTDSLIVSDVSWCALTTSNTWSWRSCYKMILIKIHSRIKSVNLTDCTFIDICAAISIWYKTSVTRTFKRSYSIRTRAIFCTDVWIRTLINIFTGRFIRPKLKASITWTVKWANSISTSSWISGQDWTRVTCLAFVNINASRRACRVAWLVSILTGAFKSSCGITTDCWVTAF